MRHNWLPFAVGCLTLLGGAQVQSAYIGLPPETLGKLCAVSNRIVSLRVETVNYQKGIVVFRKIEALKGKWPDTICHTVGEPPADREAEDAIFGWAKPGKTTVMFAFEHLQGYGYGYIDGMWYPLFRDPVLDWGWWSVALRRLKPTSTPRLLRTFFGSSDKLVEAVESVLAGKEAVVPCLEDGGVQELQDHMTRVQRMKASLTRLDYNPKRDFAAWGAEDGAGIAVKIFNGRDLFGWEGDKALWSVETGLLMGKAGDDLVGSRFLSSAREAGDFRLIVEVLLRSGNSGIQFRSRKGEDGDLHGFQVEIGEGRWGRLLDRNGRGELSLEDGNDHVKPRDWNTIELLAVGARIRVAINGKASVDYTDAEPAKAGLIAFSLGQPATEVTFTNVRLELGPEAKLKTVR